MEKLKIAIQKSGRLSDKSLELFKEAGITLTNGTRKLISVSTDFPVEVLYLRDDDIPQYVSDGVADVGIVGENEYLEKEKELIISDRLGFARCRLSLAIPKEMEYTGIKYFEGKKIATSYPVILADYLKKNNVDAIIERISGSVEIAPAIGLADAIFDIVSSGSTLISNGLKEAEIVMASEAILISNPGLNLEKKQILEKLIFRIKAVRAAAKNKYILLNAPNKNINQILKLLPGMKSPTVLPLAIEGWSSVHSVVNEADFWSVIDSLKDSGAQGILVVPIEKMII